MDIGDIIFFLIVIGLPLAQWLMRKKEQPGAGEAGLPEEDFRPFDGAGERRDNEPAYRPKRDVSDPNREWEDLMEALGRPTVEPKPAPPPLHVEPVMQPRMAAPPPVPKPAPVPALDPRVELMNRVLREARPEPSRPEDSPAGPPRTTPARRMTHGSAGHRVQRILRNPQSIRDAILVNELLSTPVSMRTLRP